MIFGSLSREKYCETSNCWCRNNLFCEVLEAQRPKEERKQISFFSNKTFPYTDRIEEPFLELINLGEGSYGSVRLIRETVSGSQFALKFLKSHSEDYTGLAMSSIREIRILRYLSAERQRLSIVEETFWPIVSLQKIRVFDQERLGLYFEYLPTDLHRVLVFPIYFDPSFIALYSYSLLEGVSFLHRCGIVHRDIKPANILLGKNGSLKIADFGMAREWRKDNIQSTISSPADKKEVRKWTQVFGTVHYRAPETFIAAWKYYSFHPSADVRKKYFKTSVVEQPKESDEDGSQHSQYDLWSVGCVIAEMFIGKPLFRSLWKPHSTYSSVGGIYAQKVQSAMEKVYVSKDLITKHFLEELSIFLGILTIVKAQRSFVKQFCESLSMLGLKDIGVLLSQIADSTKDDSLRQFLYAECVTPIDDDAIDLITRLLNANPAERIDAMSALAHPYFSQKNRINGKKIALLRSSVEQSLTMGGWQELHSVDYFNNKKIRQFQFDSQKDDSMFDPSLKRTNKITASNPYENFDEVLESEKIEAKSRCTNKESLSSKVCIEEKYRPNFLEKNKIRSEPKKKVLKVRLH